MSALAQERSFQNSTFGAAPIGLHGRTGGATRGFASLDFGTVFGTSTTSGYWEPSPQDRTSAGPSTEAAPRDPEVAVAEAVLEVRRLCGLTWEEMAGLFGVSRRAVHHWANGMPVSANHEAVVRQVQLAVRGLYTGAQADTRIRLMSVPAGMRRSRFELLKEGRFEEALHGAPPPAPLPSQQSPLSAAAAANRRPPHPVSLLEGAQDPLPASPSPRARVAPVVRTAKKER